MSALTIPLIAVYEYDNTILDDLHVPTAEELQPGLPYIDPIPELSDATLHMELLFELGELSPVHSDPEILKKMVEIWNAVNHPTWVQLWQTMLYTYNPIWNKDGTYRETRALQKAGSETGSTTTGNTRSISDSVREVLDEDTSGSVSTTTSGNTSGSTTHSVTGYDTNSLSPAYGDTSTGTTSSTGSETSSGTKDATTDTTRTGSIGDQGSSSESNSSTLSENETFEHVEQGNIGVTTTQQMIKEQREIVQFNLYKYIIDSFKKHFMITVWDI